MEELRKSIDESRHSSGEGNVLYESPDSGSSEEGISKGMTSSNGDVLPVHGSEGGTLDKPSIGAAGNDKLTEVAVEEVGIFKSMELSISHSVQAVKEVVVETLTGAQRSAATDAATPTATTTATADLLQVEEEALLLHSAAHD